MAEYKRYSISIIGFADATDALTLHTALNQVFSSDPKMKVKTINLDEWVDGYTAQSRLFDESGVEIITNPTPEVITVQSVDNGDGTSTVTTTTDKTGKIPTIPVED